MDDKFENYEELRSYLEDLPMTWYPDLIRDMVCAAYKKKVFLPGGASHLVKRFEGLEGFGEFGRTSTQYNDGQSV